MNAICLVVDRLHIGYVGAYGNTWIRTPSLDRLAAEGFVFDQAWIDSPELDVLCRSWWLGRHAMAHAADSAPPVAARLARQGVRTVLMTDDSAVARHPLAAGFAEVLELDEPEGRQLAEDVDQTHLARCVARLIQWLETAPGPFLLWVHLQGLSAPWDAPMERRLAYADEEDPPPLETAEVPSRRLPPGFDPDEVLSVSHAYAGQVSLLDECLGALGEFLSEYAHRGETLLAIGSARGFPLGEHRRIGPCDDALYGELIHVPLLLKLPESWAAAGRSQAFVGPSDLPATLLDWWGVTADSEGGTGRSLLRLVRGETGSLHDRMGVLGRHGERAFLTPAWCFRAAERPELFVHPDDFWQANDVADRCPEVVGLLHEALDQYQRAFQALAGPAPEGTQAQVPELPPLHRLLAEGIE